jgi:hypothetical protein
VQSLQELAPASQQLAGATQQVAIADTQQHLDSIAIACNSMAASEAANAFS